MGLKEYSLGFMIDRYGWVALLRKERPDWQAGLLNGIGGKQEEGETIHDCMVREWKEETGNDHADWDHFCSLRGSFSHVHCFRTFVDELPEFPLMNDTKEMIEIWDLPSLYNGLGEPVPNLITLLRLATMTDTYVESGIGYDPRRAA